MIIDCERGASFPLTFTSLLPSSLLHFLMHGVRSFGDGIGSKILLVTRMGCFGLSATVMG